MNPGMKSVLSMDRMRMIVLAAKRGYRWMFGEIVDPVSDGSSGVGMG